MADQDDFMSAEAGKSAVNRRIVTEQAVTVKLAKFAANHLDVIAEQRPLRMPGHLNRFPGGEIAVGLAKQRSVIGAKLAKFFGIIDVLGGLHHLQIVYLLLEASKGSFELEDVSGGWFPVGNGSYRLSVADAICLSRDRRGHKGFG